MKRIITFVILTLLLSSCVTKPYKRSETASIADSVYRVLESRVDTSTNEADTHWRTFFADRYLVEYIEEAINNNLDMKVALLNIQKASAQYRQSKTAFFPSANAGVGYSIDAKDHFVAKSADYAMIQMGWEIDLWGKLASAKRAAYASLLQQKDIQQSIQTTLVAQVAVLYYTLVAYDAQIKVVKETIKNRQAYLEKIKLMKASARVTEVAVQQAVVQLSEVQAALPKLELAVIKVENALNLAMGRVSAPIERSGIDLSETKVVTRIGYSAQLLAKRPDVRAAENAYRYAFQIWNVSRAAMYPALTISATGNIADITNAHFGTLNILAGLAQPIFNGRKLRTQKDVAKLSADQAELMFRKAILTAGQEVSNAMISQQKYLETALAQIVQLRASRLSYEYSQDLFDSGYATYLDVLVAQTGVYNIEMTLINTYLDKITARVELYRALGGGVEN